jgi:hypothetical protein
MVTTLSKSALAFRLHSQHDPWPFNDPTMQALPPDVSEFELPIEWIGWHGQLAVCLLTTFTIGTEKREVKLEPDDELLVLKMAMDERGEPLYDPPTAYKAACRHILRVHQLTRVIIEVPVFKANENNYLVSIHLPLLPNPGPEPIKNYYYADHKWDVSIRNKSD